MLYSGAKRARLVNSSLDQREPQLTWQLQAKANWLKKLSFKLSPLFYAAIYWYENQATVLPVRPFKRSLLKIRLRESEHNEIPSSRNTLQT